MLVISQIEKTTSEVHKHLKISVVCQFAFNSWISVKLTNVHARACTRTAYKKITFGALKKRWTERQCGERRKRYQYWIRDGRKIPKWRTWNLPTP